MRLCVLCVFIQSSRGFSAFFPDIKVGFWSCCSIYHAQIANGVPDRDLMTSQEALTNEWFWVNQVKYDEKYSSFPYKIFRKIEKCYWHWKQPWSSRLTWTLPDPSTDVHRLACLYPSILHATASSDELPDFALLHPFLSHRVLLCRSALAVGSTSRFPPHQAASGDLFSNIHFCARQMLIT